MAGNDDSRSSLGLFFDFSDSPQDHTPLPGPWRTPRDPAFPTGSMPAIDPAETARRSTMSLWRLGARPSRGAAGEPSDSALATIRMAPIEVEALFGQAHRPEPAPARAAGPNAGVVAGSAAASADAGTADTAPAPVVADTAPADRAGPMPALPLPPRAEVEVVRPLAPEARRRRTQAALVTLLLPPLANRSPRELWPYLALVTAAFTSGVLVGLAF